MTQYLDTFKLNGKTALVTGASEGIGQEIAIGFAQAGADVVVCSRNKDKLKDQVATLRGLGVRAEAVSVDVTRTADIEALRDYVSGEFGKLDILVNSAAYTINALAFETSEEDWDLSIDTSFKGTFFACQILGSLMRDQGYGKIINMSSTFSRATVPQRSVYAGVKAGISHLTEALALEWGPLGIRVNALAPTAVRTPSREELLQGAFLESIVSRIPLGRIAETSDIAPAAIYLASPASDFVTGQTLFVDGGFVAHG
ncbi:MAG: SDR family oxidoreductase [Rhodospirillales bacterium]|nr:SDR family oxidoreductase [Rhodospirillales bacterium]